MDNFAIELTAEGRETLADALRLAFRHNAPGGEARFWVEVTAKTGGAEWIGANANRRAIILLWEKEQHGADEVHRLPTPLDAVGVLEVVDRWLAAADLGPEPDIDGSLGRGFRVFTDFWGHVESYTYAIVGVAPAWAMYGK